MPAILKRVASAYDLALPEIASVSQFRQSATSSIPDERA